MLWVINTIQSYDNIAINLDDKFFVLPGVIFIFLLLFAIINPIYSLGTSTFSNVYVNEKFKFKIEYPITWKALDTNYTSYQNIVTFKNFNVSPSPEIEIIVREIMNESDPLKNLESKIKNLQQFGLVKKLESNYVNNSDTQIYSIIFLTESSYDPNVYKTQQVYFIFGKYLFQLSYKATLDSFNKYYPIFSKSINTFDILK